jgi:hypothetical protein
MHILFLISHCRYRVVVFLYVTGRRFFIKSSAYSYGIVSVSVDAYCQHNTPINKRLNRPPIRLVKTSSSNIKRRWLLSFEFHDLWHCVFFNNEQHLYLYCWKVATNLMENCLQRAWLSYTCRKTNPAGLVSHNKSVFVAPVIPLIKSFYLQKKYQTALFAIILTCVTL